MAQDTSWPTVQEMHTIPSTARIHALHQRQQQLEQHLQRCRSAVEQRHGPNPSVGRELDDTRSVLAKVRADLAWLESR
jgi:hypothetical protein